MFAPMQYQIRFPAKQFITVGALDRLSRMQRHVCLENSVLCEAFVADVAFVWLFSSLSIGCRISIKQIKMNK